MFKVLITAGCTTVPIDQVRAVTNIFKGRTGASIAEGFAREGHDVTLITSNRSFTTTESNLSVVNYKTFDDLNRVMEMKIVARKFDMIIHSAAVSDYRVAGVYTKNYDGTLAEVNSDNKVSSSHNELFMRLTPTAKLIDKIRADWGFTGTLVKFKLEVGISDVRLHEIAHKSMLASRADMIVANCLEWSAHYAYIIEANGNSEKVSRRELPSALLRRV